VTIRPRRFGPRVVASRRVASRPRVENGDSETKKNAALDDLEAARAAPSSRTRSRDRARRVVALELDRAAAFAARDRPVTPRAIRRLDETNAAGRSASARASRARGRGRATETRGEARRRHGVTIRVGRARARSRRARRASDRRRRATSRTAHRVVRRRSIVSIVRRAAGTRERAARARARRFVSRVRRLRARSRAAFERGSSAVRARRPGDDFYARFTCIAALVTVFGESAASRARFVDARTRARCSLRLAARDFADAAGDVGRLSAARRRRAARDSTAVNVLRNPPLSSWSNRRRSRRRPRSPAGVY